ncbi:MAG TPA: DUF1232 domain-containing protein [Thermoanaerobaculia bacterium]|nr:DUF1232 domain-containing protein [Thermoanaerobaculia bacterium]
MPDDRTPHDPLTDDDLEDFDAARAERESEEALARGTELPSSGLLSFYDRLREAIFKVVEKRGGKLSEGTIRALMLVPDVFILLVRLALDKEVPGTSRALIGGAIAYFILPFDLLPEAILGPAGYLDDLVLATAVLAQAFGGDLEPYARKHWSGKEDLRIVLRDISETAQSLLGQNLYDRLRRLLSRRGVKIESGSQRFDDED